MPTRKQVRRRQKERRHEYEYVYVDEEGNEVAPEDAAEPDKPRRDAAGRKDRKPARNARGRAIQPPSWRRVGKRGLIFAPLMFLTVYLLAGDELPLAGVLVQTFFLLAIFLPFSYAMDAMTYRMWRRRTGQAETPRGG